jgi:predicted translin family RNA/ssDNA-binding protein
VVKEHPTLRSGAFSNSLEEWAEGELTLEWVENKRIKTMAELRVVNIAEYVGALSDFTGEAGRIAVAHASKRQMEDVRDIQQVDLVVSQAITRMNGVTPRFSKKLDAVNTNLRKVEDLIFELSMAKRGSRGGKKLIVDAIPDDGKETKEEE